MNKITQLLQEERKRFEKELSYVFDHCEVCDQREDKKDTLQWLTSHDQRIIEAVVAMCEEQKIRLGNDVGKYKWREIEGEYNKALNDLISTLRSALNNKNI